MGTDYRIRGTGKFGSVSRNSPRRRSSPPPPRGRFAHTPEQITFGAAGVGALSALGGLTAALTWNTPADPCIAVVTTVLFALGLVVGAVVFRGVCGVRILNASSG